MTDESLDLPLELTLPAARQAGAETYVRLGDVDRAGWEALCAERLEGNGMFDPGFALPATELAGGARALLGFAPGGRRLVALLPVLSAWRALKLPLRMLVTQLPYTVLSAPLLDKADPVAAAGALIEAAQRAGAAVLMLSFMPVEGLAAQALNEAMARRGVSGTFDNVRSRVMLDATGEAEAYLRAGMGAKKLKELRRQSHRMADEGEVRFSEAVAPADIGLAIERFLLLEASGWKGQRGTGLGQHEADSGFVRQAARDLGGRGRFRVLELWLGGKLIASGLVIRQGDHALFFKIAFDEAFSRFSPGVQLTVELTRRCCEDPTLGRVDSAANAGHPMIDHVWRERFLVGDLFIPTGCRRGPLAAAMIGMVIARPRLRQRAKSLYYMFKSSREKRT